MNRLIAGDERPPPRPWSAHGLAVFLTAICLGALAWLASAKASGFFEPYDSTIGILVNQAVLIAGAIGVGLGAGLRHSPGFVLIFLLGAYVGLNAYPYAFGSSESRAWAALGAVASLILLVVPAVCSLALLAYRVVRERQEHTSRPR